MAEEPSLHRIAKLLARAGVASRRDVERMIEEGRVALNGERLDTPATLLPTLAGVTVDGEPVAEAEPTRLFLFHKPAGYLTAARDPMGRPTIYDRLPADLPRLVPVGRLDLNTEGLLLLTTDGAFKRQLELPSTGVERAYRARAYGDVTQAQLEALIDGVEIDGIRYGSIDANLERRTGANVWVEMILTEGKNREVRRVLEYLGLQVSRLIRTRYGPFVMGDLPVGGIGEVHGADLVAFRNSLKGNTRLSPDQAGTITASAIRPGTAAGPTASPRVRSDRSPDPANNRAPAPPRDAGYDPTQAPRADDTRVRTRGAFGTRPARENGHRTGATESGRAPQRAGDRTAGRAPAEGDQRRTRSPQGVNEPEAARGRRPARVNLIDEQPRARFSRDATSGGERARPQRPTRDGQARRPARDSAYAESDRSQRPTRSAHDTRANRPEAKREPQRDEPSTPPRPPRPERKPGWARAKPKSGAKPGARPGKPRK